MPSLYANLLDPKLKEAATISGEPIKYDFKRPEDPEAEKKKTKDAALRFAPQIKRPKVAPKKPRPAGLPPSLPTSKSNEASKDDPRDATGSAPLKPTIDQFITNDDEDEGDPWAAEYRRRQEAERLKSKSLKKGKKKQKAASNNYVSWDAIYDPAKPTRLDLYRGSEEHNDAVDDWKALLYGRRRQVKDLSPADSDSARHSQIKNRPGFAPPSFAPPSSYDAEDDNARAERMHGDRDGTFEEGDESETYAARPRYRSVHTAPPTKEDESREQHDYVPPVPASNVPADASGEDAYMRRMRLSGMQAAPPAAILQPPQATPHHDTHSRSTAADAPSALPARQGADIAGSQPLSTETQPNTDVNPSAAGLPLKQPSPAVPQASTPLSKQHSGPLNFTSGATLSAAPILYNKPSSDSAADPASAPISTTSATLSAAPVLYNQPRTAPPSSSSPQTDTPESAPQTPAQEEDEPRSSRPGQKNFGRRFLEKFGWKEGQGLGASGDGITTILRAQPEKRKKRPDAEGGGFIGPAGGIARIVGGKRQKLSSATGDEAADETSSQWSEVAVFEGMLEGVDVQREMEQGTLMQDIGEAMGRYGIVERLYLDRRGQGDPGRGTRVFVKFTSVLSAYRVIQDSNGRDFLGNGRVVESAFFDVERFEEGNYD
ncbi:hypothetical protein CAC42_6613 [Sphaceloma murrayae]|uniref:G-patch domain-containing protein n=1 Tax=Sphaceloma murrayae TaxID=2082308 RepID=A0A2K1QGT8_9PEZI|nr:hypothetical protein CAC42_6613 [Sphaceloma murrayae]